MKAKRRDLDAYFTRRRFDVDVLRKHLPLVGGEVFLEPCVGDGDIAKFLPGRVVTNDIDHRRAADYHLDATAPSSWRRLPAADWVVTNPPFNMAHLILPHAFAHARRGVAFYVRRSFLEPCENRAHWLETHPATKAIVMSRFSFDGTGSTDSVTCEWVIWDKQGQPAIYVEPYDAEEAGQIGLFTAPRSDEPAAATPGDDLGTTLTPKENAA